MAKPHNLTVLPFAKISSDFSAYNSHFHTEQDIVAVLASPDGVSPQFTHAWPPHEPYAYTHHATLIAKSQGIDLESCIELPTPGHIAQEILLMQCSKIARNEIKHERIEEVVEEWTGVKACRAMFDTAFGTGDAVRIKLPEESSRAAACS